MKLSIDIATDIYPMQNKPSFTLQLASTLHRDLDGAGGAAGGAGGTAGARRDHEAWRIDVPGNEGISADFDYVMHGKVSTRVLLLALGCGAEQHAAADDDLRMDLTPAPAQIYKFDEGLQDEVTVYGSFGGLLMALTGSYRHLSGITIGEYVYLLIR